MVVLCEGSFALAFILIHTPLKQTFSQIDPTHTTINMDRDPDANCTGNFSAYRSTKEVFSLNETTGEDPLDLDGGDSPTKRLSTLNIDEDTENPNSSNQPMEPTAQVCFPLRQTSIHKFFTKNIADLETPDSITVSAATRSAHANVYNNIARPIRSSSDVSSTDEPILPNTSVNAFSQETPQSQDTYLNLGITKPPSSELLNQSIDNNNRPNAPATSPRSLSNAFEIGTKQISDELQIEASLFKLKYRREQHLLNFVYDWPLDKKELLVRSEGSVKTRASQKRLFKLKKNAH